MSNPKFKEGAWVKEKTGTKGMTVISTSTNGNNEAEVRCRFTNENGEEVEGDFRESDLVAF